MGRSFASATFLTFLMVPAVWLPSGCAASVKQAAETATPAVVEGVAEEAEDKGTREAVATILGDPDIRASSSQLSSALVKGMVRGAQEEVQLAEVQRWTDALVTSLGASLARSIERDVAPRLSATVGRVVDESLERALDARTEERLQAVVGSVTRATLVGAGDAMSTLAADEGPSFREAFARLTHDVAYSGALGVDNAVRDAQLARPAFDSSPSVLVGLGTLGRWAGVLPPLLVGGAALVGLCLFAALVWALATLWRLRRQLREQTDQLRSYDRTRVAAPDRTEPRLNVQTRA